MKTNFILALVILSLIIILGILGSEYYISNKAIDAGLQECLVTVDGKTVSKHWAKECDQIVIEGDENDSPE